MFYSAELEFLRRVLYNFHIDTCIITEGEPVPADIDKGLREFLELHDNYIKLFDLCGILKPNVLYTLTDIFSCRYVFLLLPETEKKQVLIIILK